MNSTVGTIFYFSSDEGTTNTQIYGMISKPAMPGMPTSVDATSQEDEVQMSVAGARQMPEANFQFKYAAFDATTSNFEKFLALEGEKTLFGIKYPDGSALEFNAKPYVQRDGTGVNALDTFTVGMFEITDLDIDATAPTIVMVDAGE